MKRVGNAYFLARGVAHSRRTIELQRRLPGGTSPSKAMAAQSTGSLSWKMRFVENSGTRGYSSSVASSRSEPVTVDRHYGSDKKADPTPLPRGARKSRLPQDGLSLGDFVHRAERGDNGGASAGAVATTTTTTATATARKGSNVESPLGTFHIKTYGCQMNVSDSDIVRAVLLEHGYVEATEENTAGNRHATNPKSHHKTKRQQSQQVWTPESTADIILTNTCAIREKAEEKVWQRLRHLRKNKGSQQIVGVLGCMAERLQTKLLEENVADLVVGPDAYRDLPRLLQQLNGGEGGSGAEIEAPNSNMKSTLNIKSTLNSSDGTDDPQPPEQNLATEIPFEFEHPDRQQQSTTEEFPDRKGKGGTKVNRKSRRRRPKAINVDLSTTETYEDIMPVRGGESSNPFSAFVSIQRGCSNRCSFCIVPFTRGGKERSRPFQSIVDEVSYMVETQNLKEVVLLGQNVNSYHDRSPLALQERPELNILSLSNEGFRTRIRRPNVGGYRFVDLVEAVADISPELRIRYTSPHPKDYPVELLQLMAERPNVCSQLHMPAQSGSTEMLKRMKRGYTREAYLELIDTVRTVIPDVAISSDFIAGFCDETEQEHADTLSLLEYVEYEQAFLFAYSMRDKTHASRAMEDNVAADVKQRRLQELIDVFREKVHAKNERVEVGRLRLVLVEGPTKKQRPDAPEGRATWHGRTDQNKRILFDVETSTGDNDAMNATAWKEDHALEVLRQQQQPDTNAPSKNLAGDATTTDLATGDYAVVSVTEAKGHTLRGRMLWKTTLSDFARFESGYLSKLQPHDLDILQNNPFREWSTNPDIRASLRAK